MGHISQRGWAVWRYCETRELKQPRKQRGGNDFNSAQESRKAATLYRTKWKEWSPFYKLSELGHVLKKKKKICRSLLPWTRLCALCSVLVGVTEIKTEVLLSEAKRFSYLVEFVSPKGCFCGGWGALIYVFIFQIFGEIYQAWALCSRLLIQHKEGRAPTLTRRHSCSSTRHLLT